MDFPTPDNLGIPQAGENPSQGQPSQSEPSVPQGNQEPTASQQALIDLDRAEKFKFEGREWSREDFRKAYLRQEDYTKKTQTLAEERKALAGEQKFYENLHYDLSIVKSNPQMASEFIKLYPQKFHQYLKDVLNENRQASAEPEARPTQSYDVDTQSKLQKLEQYVHEQEVAKNTAKVNEHMDTFSKKYPDAIPEAALALVYDAYNSGEQITPELFERAFKQNAEMVEARFKAKYSDMVKKQTTANKKGADVDAGGGTLGKAPPKFKSLDEVAKFAIEDLSGKR